MKMKGKSDPPQKNETGSLPNYQTSKDNFAKNVLVFLFLCRNDIWKIGRDLFNLWFKGVDYALLLKNRFFLELKRSF